jgi:hypothetical protein
LLNPLPIHEPARVVSFFTTDAKNKDRFQSFLTTSYPNFKDYREQSGQVLSGMAATQFVPLSLTSGGEPQQIFGEMVTGNYFDVLGVRPPSARPSRSRSRRTSSSARTPSSC